MKKLQNNFTTLEQSKRLLELGVPADSADLFYRYYINLYEATDIWEVPTIIGQNQHIEWSHKLRNGDAAYTPCWSVGRLIEIMVICYKWDLLSCASFRIYATDIIGHNLINQLINDLSLEISRGKIDFSKLED